MEYWKQNFKILSRVYFFGFVYAVVEFELRLLKIRITGATFILRHRYMISNTGNNIQFTRLVFFSFAFIFRFSHNSLHQITFTAFDFHHLSMCVCGRNQISMCKEIFWLLAYSCSPIGFSFAISIFCIRTSYSFFPICASLHVPGLFFPFFSFVSHQSDGLRKKFNSRICSKQTRTHPH